MILKLIICLLCFTFLSILAVWVFQVFMSDALYENVKKREQRQTAEYIKEQVIQQNRDVEKKIDEYAEKNNICIGLYSVSENKIEELYASLVFVDEDKLNSCHCL